MAFCLAKTPFGTPKNASYDCKTGGFGKRKIIVKF